MTPALASLFALSAVAAGMPGMSPMPSLGGRSPELPPRHDYSGPRVEHVEVKGRRKPTRAERAAARARLAARSAHAEEPTG